MNYFDYLKRKFPLYIICGVILGIMLSMVIAVSRYNENLENALFDLENIGNNKSRIVQEIKQIDEVGDYLRREFRIDVSSVDADLYIFQAVDDMKTALQGSAITLAGFEKNQGRNELLVSITSTVGNYKMVLDYVHYLESFRLPDFLIRNLSISTEQGEKVVLNIKGALTMPVLESSI